VSKTSPGRNLILTLVALGLIASQVLIGGARPAYALPAYLVLAASALAIIPLWKVVHVQPNLVCVGSAVALALYLGARALLSPVPYLARPDLCLILAGLVVYLLGALYLSGTKQRLALILILVLFSIGHVALGVVQFKDQQHFMPLPWTFRPDFGFRASGFYISPNHLAALLGMLAVLTLSICAWSRLELSKRAFAFYGFIVCLTGIALTGSRGGYFSTAAGLVAFGALSFFLAQRFNRPNFFGVAVATAFVLTCVVVVSLLFVVQSEIYEKRLRHVQDPSRQARLLAPAAFQQLRLNPVWGTGSGTFTYYGRQFRDPAVQNDPQHAHNDFLELLAEYGWVGAALFGIFLGAHLTAAAAGMRCVLEQKIKPTAHTASNELALLVGTICALTVGLVHASRDFTFHLPANALLAAFLCSILANPTVETPGCRRRERLPGWLSLSPLAAAALLLLAAAPHLWAEVLAERARLALRDRDFPAALDLARDAMRRDPGNPEVCYYAGEALHYQALVAGDPAKTAGLRREAVAAYELGLKAFPRDVRLLLKLGLALDDLGQFARGDTIFQQALDAAPNSGTVHGCVALHWHRQRQFEKARRFYLSAQRLGETQLSRAGLPNLDRDEAAARSENAFEDLLPDADER
jgi:O-antigen ligase